MRRYALWALALVVIAGAAVGGFFWFRRQISDASSVEVLRTDRVVRDALDITVSASSQIASKATTAVMLNTTGTVSRIWVSLNDAVSTGQRLVTMETTDLERALKQAEIALEQAELALSTVTEPTDPEDIRVAEVALSNAAAALETARLGRETARVDADAMLVQAQRQREQAFIRYREAQSGSERERAERALEEAEAEERIAQLNASLTQEQAQAQWQATYNAYMQAKNNLDTLRQDVDATTVRQRELQVEQARLRRDQAQRAVNDATLVAPHDGTIAQVNLLEGTHRRAGDVAFIIVDTSETFADVRIDEIDIGALAVGQHAELTLDAYPSRALPCIVHSIAPSPTNIGGLITFQVRLRVLDTDGLRVLDGMTGSARIVTDIVEDALLVPSWAVRVDQATGETYCYRIVDGRAEWAAIELGRRDEFSAEIISGLREGDEVALVTTQRSFLEIASQAGPPGRGP